MSQDKWPTVTITPILRLAGDAIEKREREGQLQWMNDLKEVLEAGDVDTALATIVAAIKLLER